MAACADTCADACRYGLQRTQSAARSKARQGAGGAPGTMSAGQNASCSFSLKKLSGFWRAHTRSHQSCEQVHSRHVLSMPWYTPVSSPRCFACTDTLLGSHRLCRHRTRTMDQQHAPGTTAGKMRTLFSTMRPTGCSGNRCSGQILVTSSGSKSNLSSSRGSIVCTPQSVCRSPNEQATSVLPHARTTTTVKHGMLKEGYKQAFLCILSHSGLWTSRLSHSGHDNRCHRRAKT